MTTPRVRDFSAAHPSGTALAVSAAHAVGISPRPLEGQPPGARRDELVNRIRPPRAWRVEAHRRRCLQQRCRNFPKSLDSLGGGEEGAIALHGVKDQSLIGLEYVADQAGIMHGELLTRVV